MKLGYNSVIVINEKDNTYIGVALGSDHAAEHEMGIKEILGKFGIDNSKLKGWKGRTSTKSVKVNKFNHEGGVYSISTQEGSRVRNADQFLKDEVYGYWDDEDFEIISKDHSLIDVLAQACKNKNILIYRGRTGNPFDNGKLMIYIKSNVPEELKEFLDKADEQTRKELEGSKESRVRFALLKQKLKKKATQWSYEHPTATYGNPFSPTYLDMKSDGRIWLNSNIYGITSGFVDCEFVQKWIDESPEVLGNEIRNEHPKSFAEIEEHYETSKGERYSGEPEFNHHAPKSFEKFNEKQIKTIMKGKLNKELIELIEGQIKYYLNDHRTDENNSLADRIMDSPNDDNKWFHSWVKDDMDGMRYLLNKVGNFPRGYSNTPTERTNMSWWFDFIKKEYFHEFFQKNRIRRFKCGGYEVIYHLKYTGIEDEKYKFELRIETNVGEIIPLRNDYTVRIDIAKMDLKSVWHHIHRDVRDNFKINKKSIIGNFVEKIKEKIGV